MRKEKIVILGAGESGVGAALLAKAKGFDVLVSDYGTIEERYKNELIENAIPYEEKKHTLEAIIEATTVVKSPGIPDTVAIIKEIKARGIEIISEIEFGGRYTDAKMICITGTNGKTTTTTWVYHTLKKARLKVGLAGNIGKSLARQVVDNEYDIYVLELSSFQLEGMFDFKADISILLNITPDHLDRYAYNMQQYVDAKMRIIQNQTKDDYTIYCADDKLVLAEINKLKPTSKLLPFSYTQANCTASINDALLQFELEEKETLSLQVEDVAIKGQHNMYNAMATGIAAMATNVKKDVIRESLMNFSGVEHRLERAGQVAGVKFINDSKATNINATWYALESMTTPTIWIAGGVDKGNDYKELLDVVKHVKALVCLGSNNEKLHNTFDDVLPKVVEAASMSDAISKAMEIAMEGDTVLLSPACASFDLFKNYEERGVIFKTEIRNL